MSLLPLFQWFENSAVGTGIRASTWLFAAIESIHLLGLALIGGAVLVLDMRMAGYGLKELPVSRLAREARPWLMISLGLLIPTGVLLFLSESVKCYYSPAFWVKMASLFLALLFTFTVHWKVAIADESDTRPFWSKLVAACSVLLWFGVAWGGRWIGFQ